MDTTMMAGEVAAQQPTCYDGGDIFWTFVGTLICGVAIAIIAWKLYKKYWNSRKGTHLVIEDPESGKGGEFAFDNPAFKTDGQQQQQQQQKAQNSSPLDTKWLMVGAKENGNRATLTNEKRKSQDDNAVDANNVAQPRVIGLRGSDFTGLGIELCGGLKEGIFVRKVMPQGPATGHVNVGDKITSITIDFNHLVLEDAVAILSYASPYNVQLELVDAKANVSAMSHANSPKSNTSTLSHPLYRSGSQSDVNTIERNSRKNLFPEEKDASPKEKTSPKPQAKVHKENELKAKASSLTRQFRDMIEEKFQNKSYVVENGKNGGVSPTPAKDEVDAVKTPTTPTEESKKGLKFGIRVLPVNMFGKSPSKVQADNENNVNLEKSDEKMNTHESNFQRQLSINSSGIKRDAQGIPQEMPEHMMQAALTAKDNRRGNSNDKSKGKTRAPKPPPVEIDMNVSTETMDTTIDIYSPRPVDVFKGNDQLNFTDNFSEMMTPGDRPSNSSTPKSSRRKLPSDTESQINARYDNDSEADDNNHKMTNGHIMELSANDITVHQSSEEEDNEENRKTASLGDLSLPVAAVRTSTTPGGTLERAQSLEMTENGQISSQPAPPPKKRKAPVVSDSDLSEKEPRLMVTDLDGMEQRGRLKSANEWGNLEDAISGKSTENNNSDTESSGLMEDSMTLQMDESVSSLVTEVMAVLNSEQPEKRIEAEIKEFGVKMIDEVPMKTMEQLLKEKLEEAQAALATDEEDEVEDVKKNGAVTETITITTTTTKVNGEPNIKENVTVSTVSVNDAIDLSMVSPPDSPKMAELSPKMDFERNHLQDEIKISKFPFGSLERPKSDVLKKVIARKMVPLDDYTTQTTTTTTTTVITENAQPVSLTLIGGENAVELNGKPMIMDETPVYSSDNQGVNSISISSLEMNVVPPSLKTHIGSGVTISTNSQPSSIILIEDEKLDFTLRTPPNELDTEAPPTVPPMPAARNLSGQVFIVDSLSQPKVVHVETTTKTVTVTKNELENDEEEEGTGEQLSEQDVIDALKPFVTEIDVSNNASSNNNEVAEREAAKQALDSTMKFLQHEQQMSATPRANTVVSPAKEQSEPMVAPMPRNTEIKFTTSTYESTSPKSNGGGERRHSAHVDQIRSNFEKNTGSEIPVPVRKSSIPTLKLSPSKIPVFNSNGSANGATNTSPPTQRFSLTRQSPSPTGGHRERGAVSLNSIKNSARHPSGK